MRRMRNRREAALQAWKTIRIRKAFMKARAAEAASKAALKAHCEENGWRVAFFEGKTGAPRTGIIDAVAFRLGLGRPDQIDIRLIQLKGGNAGINGREITRLKDAASEARVSAALKKNGWWVVAHYQKTLIGIEDRHRTTKSGKI